MPTTPIPKAISQAKALISAIDAIRAIVKDRERDVVAAQDDAETAAALESLGYDLGTLVRVSQVFTEGARGASPSPPSTKKPKNDKG